MDRNLIRRKFYIKANRAEGLAQDTKLKKHNTGYDDFVTFKKGHIITAYYKIEIMVGFPQGVAIEEIQNMNFLLDDVLSSMFIEFGEQVADLSLIQQKFKQLKITNPYEIANISKKYIATLPSGRGGSWIYESEKCDLLKPRTDGVGV